MLFAMFCRAKKTNNRPILVQRPENLAAVQEESWQRLLDFDYLVETGMVSAGDLDLFCFVETAEEAWEVLAAHYGFDLPDTTTGEFATDI